MDGNELAGCDPKVIAVTGRLDSCAAAGFEGDCIAAVQDGPPHVILDCEALEYISSAGLRAVLALTKRLKADGGYVALYGLRGGVKDVFTVSGFTAFLPIFDSRSEALHWAKERANA